MKLLPVGYETATLLRGRLFPSPYHVPPASAVGHDGAWPSHCGQDGAWPSRDGATIGCVPINLNPLNLINLLNTLHPLNLLNLLNHQDRYLAEM